MTKKISLSHFSSPHKPIQTIHYSFTHHFKVPLSAFKQTTSAQHHWLWTYDAGCDRMQNQLWGVYSIFSHRGTARTSQWKLKTLPTKISCWEMSVCQAWNALNPPFQVQQTFVKFTPVQCNKGAEWRCELVNVLLWHLNSCQNGLSLLNNPDWAGKKAVWFCLSGWRYYPKPTSSPPPQEKNKTLIKKNWTDNSR